MEAADKLLPHDAPRDVREKVIDEFLNQFNSPTLTPHEDGSIRSMLNGMQAEIEGVCAGRKIPLKKKLIFGALNTGRVNGMAGIINNPSYYLILIEDGILGFSNLFAKCIASSFPIIGVDGERQTLSMELSQVLGRLDANPGIAERFFDVTAAYLLHGSPHAARPYFVEREYEAFSSLLRDAMEFFVLSHEYGHCSAGHLEIGTKKAFAMKGADGTAQELEELIPADWMHEFEADLLGLLISLAVLIDIKKISPSLGYAGVEMVFSCISVLERALSVIEFGEERERLLDTHPPTQLRKEMLRVGLAKMLDEESLKGSINCAEQMSSVIEHLWSVVKPAFEKLHREGARPHRRWAHS